jgi:hypothetical protein
MLSISNDKLLSDRLTGFLSGYIRQAAFRERRRLYLDSEDKTVVKPSF